MHYTKVIINSLACRKIHITSEQANLILSLSLFSERSISFNLQLSKMKVANYDHLTVLLVMKYLQSSYLQRKQTCV